MKTEGDFNAHFAKELKKLSPKLHVTKIADKFSVGISDFLIWANGLNMALESKFIKELPKKGTTKIFTHPFSGAQLTYLESIELTRNMAFGMVGIKSLGQFFIIERSLIPANGNFTRDEWENTPKMSFLIDDIPNFVLFYFGELQ